MTPADRRFRGLRRLAWLCAVMVLAVTSLSAYIRLSKAGLGCADWPACYGQSFHRMQQGAAPTADEQTATAAARLVHRITAVAALVLVIMMLLVCFGSQPLLLREGLLAVALLGLALFLAVLGRWSSGARVPAVAMGNLLGGFVMLALCVRLALAGRARAAPRWRAVSAVAVGLLLVQVALGGLVSASFASLSCTGWTDCLPGSAWQAADWGSLNPWREPMPVAASTGRSSGLLAHGLHRLNSGLLLVLVLPLGVQAWRQGQRVAGGLLGTLLAAQCALGVAMTALSLPLGLALLHNLLAAALLATLLART